MCHKASSSPKPHCSSVILSNMEGDDCHVHQLCSEWLHIHFTSFLEWDSVEWIIFKLLITNKGILAGLGTFPELLQDCISVFSPALYRGHSGCTVGEFQPLLSSSELQVPRMRSAWQWSSRTGPLQHQPRSGWGRTWRMAWRRAVRRSGLCRRSPSGTGKSNLQVWTLRSSLMGWGWCQLLTTGWGTDCGQEGKLLVFWWNYWAESL